MSRAIGTRFVTDSAAEEFEGLDVTLTRQQHSGAAVVPDRACGSFAVGRFDLSQVVVTEQELDALAGTAGGIAGEAGEARGIGGFIERHAAAARSGPCLGARPRWPG